MSEALPVDVLPLSEAFRERANKIMWGLTEDEGQYKATLRKPGKEPEDYFRLTPQVFQMLCKGGEFRAGRDFRIIHRTKIAHRKTPGDYARLGLITNKPKWKGLKGLRRSRPVRDHS